MTFPVALQFYLTLNLLIVASFLFLRIYFSNSSLSHLHSSSLPKLKIYYATFFFVLIVAAMQWLLPHNSFLKPTAKFWSAESSKTFYTQYANNSNTTYVSLTLSNTPTTFSIHSSTPIILTILISVFTFAVTTIYRDVLSLLRIRRSSYLFKKLGSVSIYLNDDISVPFSILLDQAYVFVPTSLISKQKHFRIAIAHELQHHRQGDTLAIYFIWLLRIFFFPNPFALKICKQILEIQEFVCDEALIGRKKADSETYIRCLIEVAQTAMIKKDNLHCAMGLIFLDDRHILTRRVEKMMNTNKIHKRSQTGIFCLLLSLALTATAYAATNLVSDRRVTVKEAESFAERARLKSSFPIVVNDLVLQELNRYLGTPEGRDFMKKSLARKEVYQSLLNRKFEEYHLPEELMAVPIIESGYQNLPQSENKSWGAGLWMFIESTAQNYGLRVDSVIDERLNPEILTDAALRYISANYFRFKDYQLALLGYNIGERKVQEGISRLKTRDAWQLTRNGYGGDKYLARLMAAIMIMKNPESLD